MSQILIVLCKINKKKVPNTHPKSKKKKKKFDGLVSRTDAEAWTV